MSYQPESVQKQKLISTPQPQQELKINQLFSFFLPLGISASLVTISHVIINSTLARSANPELTIASFAIAMSVFFVTERPALFLRHTCSALVRDRLSYRSMSMVALFVILSIFLVGLLIAYTPLGTLLFRYIFGIEDALLEPTLQAYQVLMFVSIFSGLRCLYQGVIISNMRTKWLTIGMVFRLVLMYSLSFYFIQTDQVTGARIGALIFLSGMIIEAMVSFLEGRLLVKKMPKKATGHNYHTKREVFGFYRPLVYSAFIFVMIIPAINAMLGKTANIELAIASYAIAYSLTQLVVSAFTYTHQIVLNFYRVNKQAVLRFTLFLSCIPPILIGILSYTTVGPWVLQHLMGVNESLMIASIDALRVFMIMTVVFPWVDYCNGLIMLRGLTKATVWSQSSNLAAAFLILVILTWIVPSLNGMIGALAQSIGFIAEITVLLCVLKYTPKLQSKKTSS